MINIAICDDEQSFIDELKYEIYGTEKFFNEEIEIKEYVKAKTLCNELLDGKQFDIIFMDIMMPEIDGIDVGRLIRNKLEDNVTQLVYVSSESRYAMKLFKLQPMDFLIKPVKSQEVLEVMKKAYSCISNGSRTFSFNNKGIVYRIQIRNIIYFEVIKRKIYVHTEQETFEFYGGIEEVYNRLCADDFVFIHRSYLVNLNQVQSFHNNVLIMLNGEELPISRNRRDEVRDRCLSTLF